jgi:hypothetical protein
MDPASKALLLSILLLISGTFTAAQRPQTSSPLPQYASNLVVLLFTFDFANSFGRRNGSKLSTTTASTSSSFDSAISPGRLYILHFDFGCFFASTIRSPFRLGPHWYRQFILFGLAWPLSIFDFAQLAASMHRFSRRIDSRTRVPSRFSTSPCLACNNSRHRLHHINRIRCIGIRHLLPKRRSASRLHTSAQHRTAFWKHCRCNFALASQIQTDCLYFESLGPQHSD